MSLWHKIGRQLSHPKGFGGRLTGRAMRYINAAPNRLAIAALNIQPEDTIAELGFGPGHALSLMAQLAPQGQFYGFDQSATMLAQASANNRRLIETGQLHLQQADFAILPLPNSSVDKLLAVNVIYFWNPPGMVLAECRRILKSGGRIAIYATAASTMKHWKFAANDTHQHYTKGQLLSAMAEAGFTNITVETKNLPLGVQGLIATAVKPPVSSA